MISGTSIEDIGGRKISEPFTVTLYSYEIMHVIMETAVILRKMHRYFALCSLADFENRFFSAYS